MGNTIHKKNHLNIYAFLKSPILLSLRSLYFKKVKKLTFLSSMTFGVLFFYTLLIPFSPSYAHCRGVSCDKKDVQTTVEMIDENHVKGRSFISDEFERHRNWLVNTFFKNQVLPALMLFTEQMSAVGMQQVMIIGSFLDAKHQLETQRMFQAMQVQAYKDYYPSEDFCWFGTNVRSLAASESLARLNTVSLSQITQARHLGKANISGSKDQDQDYLSRFNQFKTTYCDPKDNNWQGEGTGLSQICEQGAEDKNRTNRDIDFTALIDNPRTIDVDFTNADLGENGEEEDILALGKNLYGHRVMTRDLNAQKLANPRAQQLYLGLRSVVAKRNVAQNSYNAIVGLKSSGTSDLSGSGGSSGGQAPETWKFLGAVLEELGIEEDEIKQFIGERPSYYAQLEVLAKRIYQNPDFYANLYDKPINVKRKSVALKAIDLMLDRAIYESQLRQEMSMSVLLSSKLRGEFRKVNKVE